MALHLQKLASRLTGAPLLVYDVRADSRGVADAQRAGAQLAGLREIGASCSRIALCLPDGEAVEAALFGEGGIASSITAADALVLDCSTTSPETSRAAATRLGCGFVDAPVTGERTRAEAGTLTAMVGASEREVFRDAEVILRAFSSAVEHVGRVGDGQLCKALNNALYNVSVAAMAEALPLARAAGVDVRAFCRVVSGGTGQSFGFDKFAPLVQRRAFEAPALGYPMEAAFKDMLVVSAAAERVGVGASGEGLRVVGAARRTYEEALSAGLGAEHKGSMAKVWERRLGVTEYE